MKIFLSIPYAFNPDLSFQIANRVTAELMQEGHIVFSPVSQGHCISDHLPTTIRTDNEFWSKQDLPFVEWADAVYVVVIGENGTALIEQSKGVQSEWEKAVKCKKLIKLVKYDD